MGSHVVMLDIKFKISYSSCCLFHHWSGHSYRECFFEILASSYGPQPSGLHGPARTIRTLWSWTVHHLKVFLSQICSRSMFAICSRSSMLFKYVTRHNKTGHLSLTKKIVIFLLSERAFYQLKDDTSHVIGCSIEILWSKIDLYFFFIFFVFFPYKWSNILKCIQPASALFWCDGSHMVLEHI